MIKIDNKELRNLQEQVLQNTLDIADFKEGEAVLNQFGIKVVGRINTKEDLPPVDEYTGDYGDAYAVGYGAPYDLYIWTRDISNQTSVWFNIGKFPAAGPQGPKGDKGDRGINGTRGNKIVARNVDPTRADMVPIAPSNFIVDDSWINSLTGDVFKLIYNNVEGFYEWSLSGNIKGPQGATGAKGETGPQGPIGQTGPQGPKGDPGEIIKILDVISDTSGLPNPTIVDSSAAYLVGGAAPYNLYLIVGETKETQQWFDNGKFGDFELVKISVPLEGNTGTLSGDQLAILKNSPYNVIKLDDEYFRLSDDKSETADEYMVYSHAGSINEQGIAYLKLITINTNTLNWTLTSDRLATFDDLTVSQILTFTGDGGQMAYDTSANKTLRFGSDFAAQSANYGNTLLVSLKNKVPTSLRDLTNNMGFIDRLVDNLEYYFTKEEINQKFTDFSQVLTDEIQKWTFGETLIQYNSSNDVVKTVIDDATTTFDPLSPNWIVLFNYLKGNVLGLAEDKSIAMAYFLPESFESPTLPANLSSFFETERSFPIANLKAFKVEANDNVIKITSWNHNAEEYGLILTKVDDSVIASNNWYKNATSSDLSTTLARAQNYTDSRITSTLGNIGLVLDEINGEVI